MKVRNADINYLMQQYANPGTQAVVLYGQRQTSMKDTVLEFLKDKEHLYFCAAPSSVQEQKKLLAAIVAEHENTMISGSGYDYNDLFKSLPVLAKKRIIVLDEFQYFLKKEDGLLQAIAKLLEGESYAGECMLILMSSDVIWVTQDFLAETNDIIKYLNNVYFFWEWGFVDVAQEFREYPVKELICLYGIFGGNYKYLRHIDRTKTVKENTLRLILSKDGPLYEEAHNLLRSQLRETSVYCAILSAIAQGNEKLNDLFHVTGYSRAKISVYMKNLAAFDVIEKVHSMETGGWDNVKKGIYRIGNTFLDFWFHFVYPHWSKLQQASPEQFYSEIIEPGFDLYMERYFTKVCAEYLQLMGKVNQLPIQTKMIGTWVGKKGTIDIVIQNEIRQRIVAKCCWTKQKMGMADLMELFEAAQEAKIKSEYYYLFTAHEFEQKLHELSKEQSMIKLVDLNCF